MTSKANNFYFHFHLILFFFFIRKTNVCCHKNIYFVLYPTAVFKYKKIKLNKISKRMQIKCKIIDQLTQAVVSSV